MVKILECKKMDIEKHNNILFIRLEPENLSVTIKDIITSFSDMSWISKFDKLYVRESFLKRAEASAKYLADKIQKAEGDDITKDSGEYVVSELARQALVNQLRYLDVPLAELFKEQVSGNPGFDFYSANKEKVIIFGEAKYNSSQNAYGTGMEQVDRFIQEGQDLSDLNDIDKFFEEQSLELAALGNKAYAIAFASKKTSSERIIDGIVCNTHYENIAVHKEIIYIAVNV
ncbi:MAG: hypothetical protein HDQ99_11440 [Lachnospiraceae bacterium]|nr:hypothetical protein [Lachnospiraceae bacterium]